jgi:hypothetical protein
MDLDRPREERERERRKRMGLDFLNNYDEESI